jgi:hypothetical protein
MIRKTAEPSILELCKLLCDWSRGAERTRESEYRPAIPMAPFIYRRGIISSIGAEMSLFGSNDFRSYGSKTSYEVKRKAKPEKT